MESSSEINQSFISGYSTPPRSNIPPPSLSQPKLLTNSELKQRFSPIHFKRRHNLIRKIDGIVPLNRNLNMPVVLQNLFETKSEDDCIVPISSSINSSKRTSHQPIFDCLIVNSFKLEQENTFSIPEITIKQKLKILLEKN